MNESFESFPEFESLLAAAIDGRLTADDYDRLEQLLDASEEARQFYVEHAILHAMLRWEHAPPLGAEGSTANQGRQFEAELSGIDVVGSLPDSFAQMALPDPVSEVFPPISGIPVAPSALRAPSSPFSLDSSLGSFLFSYGASAVLLAIAILIFSLMASPEHRGESVVNHTDPQNNERYINPLKKSPESDARIPSVARIGGMVDCVWEDPTKAPAIDQIKAGDSFALKSGLMEIVYYTGARVILEGPCHYEVDSPTGGFLTLGKVVARVENKGTEKKGAGGVGRGTGKGVASGEWRVASPPLPPGEGGVRVMRQQQMTAVASGQRPVGNETASDEWQVASDSPSPRPAPPAPLFAIHTPTATVTDLGTEFGVEVDGSGETVSHVFRGRVVMRAADAAGTPTGAEVTLDANQSAKATRQGKTDVILVPTADTAKPDVAKHFTRTMRKPGQVVCKWQTGVSRGFQASKNDLMNAGQPTLSKIELVSGNAIQQSTLDKLNDGDIYGSHSNVETYDAFVPSDGSVVIVSFNTSLHPAGYDIQTIVSLTGCQGGQHQPRASQKYDVAYATVDAPDRFVAMRSGNGPTVDGSGYEYEEGQAILGSGSSEPIARNVVKLRFTFHNIGTEFAESVYREIEVLGNPTTGDPTPPTKARTPANAAETRTPNER